LLRETKQLYRIDGRLDWSSLGWISRYSIKINWSNAQVLKALSIAAHYLNSYFYSLSIYTQHYWKDLTKVSDNVVFDNIGSVRESKLLRTWSRYSQIIRTQAIDGPEILQLSKVTPTLRTSYPSKPLVRSSRQTAHLYPKWQKQPRDRAFLYNGSAGRAEKGLEIFRISNSGCWCKAKAIPCPYKDSPAN
jgi:hypothetical protein